MQYQHRVVGVKDPVSSRDRALEAALKHLHLAIDLLDQADAPGQIAAHVDLAAQQLSDAIARGEGDVIARNGSKGGEGSRPS
jgi:hypothetical protein